MRVYVARVPRVRARSTRDGRDRGRRARYRYGAAPRALARARAADCMLSVAGTIRFPAPGASLTVDYLAPGANSGVGWATIVVATFDVGTAKGQGLNLFL